jgi:outer membrane protein TolC
LNFILKNMIKKLSLFPLILILVSKIYGQEINYNTIVLPSNLTDVSIEEKLVQLAWNNNPKNDNALLESKAAKYELRKAQWVWLDHLGVVFNRNEFNLNPDANPERANFYPLYNISLRIQLGDFVQTPLNVKTQRVALEMTENNTKLLKLTIRAEVLRRYNLYLLSKEKLDVQKNIEADTYANFKLIEQRFKNGEESIQTYNNILERYTNHKIRKMEAETEYKISKIDLEELIGLKLEDVIVK